MVREDDLESNLNRYEVAWRVLPRKMTRQNAEDADISDLM